MNKEERLKDYLEGYKSQYLYRNEDGTFHELNDDIKELLEENKQLQQELNQKNKIIEEIKNNLKNSIKVQKETYKKYKSANINIYYASANKAVLDLIEELEKGSGE